MKQLNRWVYAIVGVIVLLFAGLVYAWSVLSTPIAAEFTSWTKAQLSLTFTIVMILFCIGSLLCGLLSGKLSAKMSVRIGAVLFLLGFFLASRTQSVAMLYIGFGVLCGLSSGLCYNAVMSTMVRWFPDRPGLISGVLLMGFGGGSFIIGKLYQAWTPDWIGGWRVSFVVLGIIIFVVLAICSFFFVAPGADFVAPAAKSGKTAVKAAGRDHKPLEMVKKPTFWLYYVWAIAVSAAGLALISQASGVVWEASADQTAGAVATIVGLISICNAVGRVLFGGMYDKYGRSLSMQLVNILFIITAGVLILALSTRSIVVVIIGFVLGGLAYSGVTPTNSAFCRAYFGPAHYPVNFPLINSNLIFASFGSTISGALYDASGSYNATFFLIIGLAAAGMLVGYLRHRQKEQVKNGELVLPTPCFLLSYAPQLHRRDQRPHDIRPALQLCLVRCVKPCPQHGVPVDKALDVVPLRTGDPLGDLPEGIVVMQLRHRRGTELVVHRALQQKGSALPHRRQVKARQSHRGGVFRRAVLDIHGHVVHQSRRHHGPQRLRMAAVGVQLHGVAQLLYRAQQRRKLPPQQRLAAGDGHAVQQTPPLFQEVQQSRVVRDRLHAAQHQTAVVAEGTAEVAPLQKHRAGHAAGKVQQRQLLQSVDIHTHSSLFCISPIISDRRPDHGPPW